MPVPAGISEHSRGKSREIHVAHRLNSARARLSRGARSDRQMTGDRRARTRRDKRGEGNMRGIRRVTTTAGFLVLALLPVAAAVSPDRVPAGPVPVAIAQPL